MAKRKKKSNVATLSLLAVALFTILAIVMAFLDNVKYPAKLGSLDLTQALTGFDVMFGIKEEVLGAKVEVLSFSFMALLAYLLPIAGLVTAVLFKKSKQLSVVPLACFIAGAILMFTFPEFVIAGGENVKTYIGGELAIGAIIAGIANALSAVAITAKIFLD